MLSTTRPTLIPLLVIAAGLFALGIAGCKEKSNGGNSASEAIRISFIATPQTLVAPGTVQFQDTTQSRKRITSHLWTFGDGTTSSLQNPSHNYAQPGTYTVTLRDAVGNASVILDKPMCIEVIAAGEIAAAFNCSVICGKAPLTVAFKDQSASSLGVTGWHWEMGDGGSSASQNPTHEYTVPGVYDVELTVSGPAGEDSVTKKSLICVEDPATINPMFTAAPTTGSAPLIVAFTDISTAPDEIKSRKWDFGDNSTSSEKNPTHTYASEGSYTVSLTVVCEDGNSTLTMPSYVLVKGAATVTAEFEADVILGASPLTVQFIDRSISDDGIHSWSWDFGDGNTSHIQNPIHVFVNEGHYTVKLSVTGSGASTIIKKDIITVLSPNSIGVAFTGTPTSGLNPLTVQFTDQSTSPNGISSWAWNFGDNGTSTIQNPSHAYTQNGFFSVTLTVTDNAGSSSLEKLNYISVTAPGTITAFFSATPTRGLPPLAVQFTDQSVAQQGITSRLWTFGDGGTSTVQNPLHTYNAAGSYDVTLLVTGPEGNNSLTIAGYINVIYQVVLRAGVTSVTMPDTTAVPMWGYALDSSFGALDGTITVPGPAIVVPWKAKELIIQLDNNLPYPTSLVVNGQVTQMSPVRFGNNRVRSFTHETASGNTVPVEYNWPEVRPGTFLYESGTQPAVQVQMGLYGALVKDTALGLAYAGVPYNSSAIVIFSEVDPLMHTVIDNGSYGAGNPVSSPVDYTPVYFCVNGKPYSPASQPLAAGSAGANILIRMLNAGLKSRSAAIYNNYVNVVAEDGFAYNYPQNLLAVQLHAAKTKDVIANFPAAGTYPMYDRMLGMTNSYSWSGMFLKLSVAP